MVQVMRLKSGTCCDENKIYLRLLCDFVVAVFQLENEKGWAPGLALCAQWAREGGYM